MFSTTRRIEFRDTDAAGIVHFSAFFPMMESAEHEMLRSLGIAVMPQRHSALQQTETQDYDSDTQSNSVVTWPRVSAKCDYLSVARFEDLLTIEVTVAKLGTSSVTYSFRFRRSDQGEEHTIAVGTIVVVCCRLDDSGLEKITLPDSVREKLNKHAAFAD